MSIAMDWPWLALLVSRLSRIEKNRIFVSCIAVRQSASVGLRVNAKKQIKNLYHVYYQTIQGVQTSC